jgi:H+/Cl- antiporter ClcA
MFSGEDQIPTIIASPVAYGAFILLGFAILKVLLLALSFKSGYLGGAIFPTLFAATVVALAISLLFPTVPVALLVTGVEAAAVTLLLRAPLTAIFLTSVVASASTNEVVYIIIATVTAVVIGSVLETQRKQRAMKKGESAKRTDA